MNRSRAYYLALESGDKHDVATALVSVQLSQSLGLGFGGTGVNERRYGRQALLNVVRCHRLIDPKDDKDMLKASGASGRSRSLS